MKQPNILNDLELSIRARRTFRIINSGKGKFGVKGAGKKTYLEITYELLRFIRRLEDWSSSANEKTNMEINENLIQARRERIEHINDLNVLKIDLEQELIRKKDEMIEEINKHIKFL